MATDQEIRAAGYYNIPQQKYLQNPFVLPTEQDDLTTATGGGIPYTNAFTGGGGDNARPSFNYQSSRNYRPGGMYEKNPLASGAFSTMLSKDYNKQGVKEGKYYKDIVPNTRFGAGTHLNDPNLDPGDYKPNIMPGRSEFSPLELSYMSEMPQSGQWKDQSLMDRVNMGMRNLKGVNSAYESGRSYGQLGKWAKKGIGVVPWISQGVGAFADMLGLKVGGDKSYGQRWAVDNAGFGQGTQRDQFGLYVGTGLGGSVKDRMQAKVDDILAKGLHLRNSTAKAQLADYQEKLGVIKSDEEVAGAVQADKIRKRSRDYKIKEQIRKQTGEQGIYGLHQDEGKAVDDLKKDKPPRHPPSTWTPAGHIGPDTPKDTPKDTPDTGGYQQAHGSHHFNQGGRIGYNRGRVVNPGGYAGDEDGGILEWIKSKMGSESETNPTVFGTQDSLLNQGSIGQLEEAIKSYEALMYMGELDEEQQADYELKLNQLSALTEGATQKAQGGRVPFFYGGIATAL